MCALLKLCVFERDQLWSFPANAKFDGLQVDVCASDKAQIFLLDATHFQLYGANLIKESSL